MDDSGNAYATGSTVSSDFPTTAGAFDTTYNGVRDIFVAKLNAAGSALDYSTYLGGSGSDTGAGIAVDGSGNAYVTGETSSADFPTQDPLSGLGSSPGAPDAFVTKLISA